MTPRTSPARSSMSPAARTHEPHVSISPGVMPLRSRDRATNAGRPPLDPAQREQHQAEAEASGPMTRAGDQPRPQSWFVPMVGAVAETDAAVRVAVIVSRRWWSALPLRSHCTSGVSDLRQGLGSGRRQVAPIDASGGVVRRPAGRVRSPCGPPRARQAAPRRTPEGVREVVVQCGACRDRAHTAPPRAIRWPLGAARWVVDGAAPRCRAELAELVHHISQTRIGQHLLSPCVTLPMP
jgi:hypothetical protein